MMTDDAITNGIILLSLIVSGIAAAVLIIFGKDIARFIKKQ